MSGFVTVVSGEMIDECMGDGDNTDTTSVTAELRQIAKLGSAPDSYKTALEHMAQQLDEVCAAVHTENEARKQPGDSELLLTNFDFVLGKKDKDGYCQSSTTWV